MIPATTGQLPEAGAPFGMTIPGKLGRPVVSRIGASRSNPTKLPVGDVGDCDISAHVAPGMVCTTSLRDVCPRMRDRHANLKSESNKNELDNFTS
jgi:hypothetical protein